MPDTQDAQALAEKLETVLALASPGPWRAEEWQLLDAKGRNLVENLEPDFASEHDAQLAATARNLVPFVVAALRSLEMAHDEALAAEECWRIGCLDDRNHGGQRSNRNRYVRVATYNALALARSLEEGTKP